MSADPFLDAILIEWGDPLFYPGNRIVKSHTPRLHSEANRAQSVRRQIQAAVRRAPQVMVKVTGGGRGMKSIAAHFRYITKNGRLQIEDDRGVVERGKECLLDIERQWRFGGAYIDDKCYRREAFNVMLSMPRGTDSQAVLIAAREFAKIEFTDHRYVMVLHDHQANPHVHLSVKAESKHGQRLNPRKADLHRWRERFAEQLRERGTDAEADPAGYAGEISPARRSLASEGQREGAAAELDAYPNRRYSGPAWPRRGARGLDKDRTRLGEFRVSRGSGLGDRHR